MFADTVLLLKYYIHYLTCALSWTTNGLHWLRGRFKCTHNSFYHTTICVCTKSRLTRIIQSIPVIKISCLWGYVVIVVHMNIPAELRFLDRVVRSVQYVCVNFSEESGAGGWCGLLYHDCPVFCVVLGIFCMHYQSRVVARKRQRFLRHAQTDLNDKNFHLANKFIGSYFDLI